MLQPGLVADLRLDLQDVLRLDPAHHEVICGDEIAPQASAPVDPGLRPDAADEIGDDVAGHQAEGEPRRHGALSDEVDGVHDLRIAETHAAQPSGLEAKVNPDDGVESDDAPVPAQLAREVDV